jgi:hypothetical protein
MRLDENSARADQLAIDCVCLGRRDAFLARPIRENTMRIALPALFAAGLAVVPLSAAKAQYYYSYPPCTANPLSWPFCVAGAAVGTAATIATAPFYAEAGYPYYYYGYPYYYTPAYYYPARRHYKRRHHTARAAARAPRPAPAAQPSAAPPQPAAPQ